MQNPRVAVVVAVPIGHTVQLLAHSHACFADSLVACELGGSLHVVGLESGISCAMHVMRSRAHSQAAVTGLIGLLVMRCMHEVSLG
jgi:hypothetical protein